MIVNATVDDFVNWIAEFIHAEWEGEGNQITFCWRNRDGEPLIRQDPEILIDVTDLTQTINRLAEKEAADETGIADGRCYEVFIKEETARPLPSRRFRNDFRLEDHENGLTYEICPPSDEFLLYFLQNLAQMSPLRDAVMLPARHWLERVVRGEDEQLELFAVLRAFVPRLMMLRITSDRDRSLTEFARFANSLYFQLSYNLDTAIVPQRTLDEFVRTSRINRMRRTAMNEIDAPRRFYTQDLIHHYQLAVAADSPPLQFLSFFHIAEHFFDTIFRENLIERVRDMIGDPGFSTKRKSDIERLVTRITNSMKIIEDRITFSEQEALRLTMDRYGVDPDTLLQKLQEYDASLVDYYATQRVSFADGDTTVDLRSNDKIKVSHDLAKRIYRTRNAIVHSKQGDRARYVPFRDDKILTKEVPLLRFIAEGIIIGDSRAIP